MDSCCVPHEKGKKKKSMSCFLSSTCPNKKIPTHVGIGQKWWFIRSSPQVKKSLNERLLLLDPPHNGRSLSRRKKPGPNVMAFCVLDTPPVEKTSKQFP